MKLADCWTQYKTYTADVTTQSRKLGLVIGAICWFFRSPNATFPPLILLALVFLIAFFLLDLLQSLCAAAVLRCWTRAKEKAMWRTSHTVEGDVEKPWWLDYPAFFCFVLKVAALMASFGLVAAEFLSRL